MCHRALKPCKSPMSIKFDCPGFVTPDSPVFEGPYPLCLLDYPETEDEILSTWESRASLWESHKDHFWIRQFICSGSRDPGLVLYSKDDEGAFRFHFSSMRLISTNTDDDPMMS
jgi:hypothetical protein